MIFLVCRDAIAVRAIRFVFAGTIDVASEMCANSSRKPDPLQAPPKKKTVHMHLSVIEVIYHFSTR